MALVVAIIDGTGSIGAAIGPFLAGAIPGKDAKHQLDNVFYMLMFAVVMSLSVSISINHNGINQHVRRLCFLLLQFISIIAFIFPSIIFSSWRG